jgi:hypothetical protein
VPHGYAACDEQKSAKFAFVVVLRGTFIEESMEQKFCPASAFFQKRQRRK